MISFSSREPPPRQHSHSHTKIRELKLPYFYQKRATPLRFSTLMTKQDLILDKRAKDLDESRVEKFSSRKRIDKGRANSIT